MDHKGNDLPYDKVYFVGGQDFYVPKDADGITRCMKCRDGYADVLEVMNTLTPIQQPLATPPVFNGAVGALTGDNA